MKANADYKLWSDERWAELAASHKRVGDVLGDLTRALHAMVPRVLDVVTVQLDANGQASGQYRLPYRCLAVDSQSAHVLTVANTPLSTSPGAGPGIGFVRVGGFATLNIPGYVWSIYGGAQGELVTITAYANAQHPYAR